MSKINIQPLTYKKEMVIQAAHFNSGATYNNYHEAMRTKNFNLLRNVLMDQHGHNFKVLIEVENMLDTDTLFVVDDEKLAEIVNEWNNTNLTLHSDFESELNSNKRISLELMVVKLQQKLQSKMNLTRVKITIYETDTISASVRF